MGKCAHVFFHNNRSTLDAGSTIKSRSRSDVISYNFLLLLLLFRSLFFHSLLENQTAMLLARINRLNATTDMYHDDCNFFRGSSSKSKFDYCETAISLHFNFGSWNNYDFLRCFLCRIFGYGEKKVTVSAFLRFEIWMNFTLEWAPSTSTSNSIRLSWNAVGYLWKYGHRKYKSVTQCATFLLFLAFSVILLAMPSTSYNCFPSSHFPN